jgi:hypothetical protein
LINKNNQSTSKICLREAGPEVQIFSPRPVFPHPDQLFTMPAGRPLSFGGTGLREYCGDFSKPAFDQLKIVMRLRLLSNAPFEYRSTRAILSDDRLITVYPEDDAPGMQLDKVVNYLIN